MSVVFEVVEDPARACAALMLGTMISGGDVVLAGGSTPRAAYEQLAETVGALGLDVSRARLWIGDERCVEPDDERSNYGMIKAALLDPLGVENQPAIERIEGELGPEAAAEDYERRLRDTGPGEFDLVLLGIGPDGHTASLFPDQASLAVRDRLVVGVPEAGLEPFVARVSLTLPALTAARQVVLLAEGSGKAEAIGRAFGPEAEPGPAVPASLLGAQARELTVLIDGAAAARLPVGQEAS